MNEEFGFSPNRVQLKETTAAAAAPSPGSGQLAAAAPLLALHGPLRSPRWPRCYLQDTINSKVRRGREACFTERKRGQSPPANGDCHCTPLSPQLWLTF